MPDSEETASARRLQLEHEVNLVVPRLIPTKEDEVRGAPGLCLLQVADDGQRRRGEGAQARSRLGGIGTTRQPVLETTPGLRTARVHTTQLSQGGLAAPTQRRRAAAPQQRRQATGKLADSESPTSRDETSSSSERPPGRQPEETASAHQSWKRGSRDSGSRPRSPPQQRRPHRASRPSPGGGPPTGATAERNRKGWRAASTPKEKTDRRQGETPFCEAAPPRSAEARRGGGSGEDRASARVNERAPGYSAVQGALRSVRDGLGLLSSAFDT